MEMIRDLSGYVDVGVRNGIQCSDSGHRHGYQEITGLVRGRLGVWKSK